MAVLIGQVLMRGLVLGFCKQQLVMHRKIWSLNALSAKRLLSMCIVALGLSSSLSNVAGQKQVSAVAWVPPTAVAIVNLNWTVAQQDERFRAMLNADQLDRALEQLKINGKDISEVVLFSGINTSLSSGVVAGIFRGSYSIPIVAAQLRSQNLSEQIYKKRTIYFNPADKSCSTILRSGILVVGSKKGVEGVIDVEDNPRTGLVLRRPFTSLLAKFVNSRQPISFVMGLPLEYRALADVGLKVVSNLLSLSGVGSLGYVIEKIGFPDVIGFSIERKGAAFPVQLLAQMKDDTSAALISGSLSLMQSLGSNLTSDQMSAADREMLKSLEVVRDDALLSIKLVLREQDLPH